MRVNISINYASVWFFPLGCYIPQSRVVAYKMVAYKKTLVYIYIRFCLLVNVSEISLSELYAHYAAYLWESHRTISYGIELRIVGEMNLTEHVF